MFTEGKDSGQPTRSAVTLLHKTYSLVAEVEIKAKTKRLRLANGNALGRQDTFVQPLSYHEEGS